MDQETRKIECPNCGNAIDVNEILYHQLDGRLKKKYEGERAKERKRLEEQETDLRNQQEVIEKQKTKYADKLNEDVQQAVKEQKLELEKSIKKRIEEEQVERDKSVQDELNEKSNQLKDFNKIKSDYERVKREKSELKGKLELEGQKELNERLAKEKEKIQRSEESRTQLKVTEKVQVINQLKDQLQAAQRKAEQGSMQLQGEVQELAIEEWLAEQFPLDVIEEIKKGERGADCLQVVHTRSHQNCGSIYYESKRTKSFQPSWIEKFKADIRDRNANIGVLVTEAMPQDMDRLGMKDGIWICTFEEFKGLSVVLRQSIIQVSNAMMSQENRGDKMTMLYDFLTSNEFQLQMEAIVEGFTQMELDLRAEQRSMNALWKKRQKQIDKVLMNTTHMYGSIKGIAGNAVQTITLLESPTDDEEL